MMMHELLPGIGVETLGLMGSDMPVLRQDRSEFWSGKCGGLLAFDRFGDWVTMFPHGTPDPMSHAKWSWKHVALLVSLECF